MTTSRLFAAWLACLCIALPFASRADDLNSLKGEVAALKSDYEARIAKLEARINQLETQAASTAPAATAGGGVPADVLAAAAPAVS